MKEETKELIDWIKKQISLAGTIVTDISQSYWQQDRDKALELLNSLPEIESHLCKGGYIQDRNGVPCCEGDKLRVSSKEGIFVQQGTLSWDVYNCSFCLKDDNGLINHYFTRNYNFEKVEE